MRTYQGYSGASYEEMPGDVNGGPEPGGQGWVVFAAILLGLAGIWNTVEGIAAIAGAHVYPKGVHYVFGHQNTWGWIMVILGVTALIAATSLLSGSEWARWFGIAVAAVNAIGQLMFIPAYPAWGLLLFGVDILIIYGLAAYAGKRLAIT
jgi:hypothetical protein